MKKTIIAATKASSIINTFLLFMVPVFIFLTFNSCGYITGGIYRFKNTNTDKLKTSTKKCDIIHRLRLFVFKRVTLHAKPMSSSDAQVIQLRFAIENTPHINGWLATNNTVE